MKKKTIFFSIVLLISLSLTYLYARYVGTDGLIVKEYKIDANIENSFNGLKVVHFSDIHYKMITDKDELEEIVEKINFIKPDIVTFTGDLFDNEMNYKDEDFDYLENILSKINAKFGKYAVRGENDNEHFDILSKSGFIILDNKYELIYNKNNNPILIAGTTSNLIDKTDINEKLSSTYSYLIDNNTYKIILMHEPDYIDKISNFDLVLSGHSHKAGINISIFKDFLLKEGAKKYFSDYYYVNNMNLYISSGIGTDSLKLRLFNKPSINFYRIVKG